MTDISVTSPADGEQSLSVAEHPFYVVSRRKLTILFIATFGVYAIYWYYKNWSQYRKHGPSSDEARESIWPVPRAIFSIFFIHSLFNKVKALGQDQPQVAAWRDDLGAWWLVILSIAVSVLDRMERKSIGLPYTSWFGYLGFLLLLFAYLKAQAMINASCGDPLGKSNDKLTGANWVWIVIGGLCWVGLFMSGFMEGAADGYSSAGGHGF
jgi:hypothetical protein